MLNRIAVLGLFVLLEACGTSPQKTTTTTPPPTGTNIDPTVSAPLAANLAAQAAHLTGPAALSAQAAALALQAGTQATAVTLTAGFLARPPAGAALDARSSSTTLNSGAASAYAFQLTAIHSPQGASTQVFSGAVLFQDAADAALGAGLSPGGPIPPAVGFVLSGGQLWEATAGQESAQFVATVGPCPLTGLPTYITSCNLAYFSNAGFAITASTPFTYGATGSQAVSIPNGAMVGASLTLDCSQTSLCGIAASVAVTISPSTATLAPSAQQQFTATVTGTSNTAVTWSVQEMYGGTVTNTGLYTASPTAGTFHVQATSVADPLQTAVATVTVSNAGVIAVSLSPSSASVAPSGTQQFRATVTGTSNTAVNWSVQEEDGGSVSGTGLYTAPATAGTYHVVASSVVDSTKFAVAAVTVSSDSAFFGAWYGPYSIALGSQYLSGDATVPITAGSGGDGTLSVNFLCVAPNLVQATVTSPTSFVLQSITCPLESQTCDTATLSFTSGAGELNEAGTLSMTFAGSEDVCGTVTDFTGSFGPAANDG